MVASVTYVIMGFYHTSEINHRRPDITVHDKNNNKVFIIDIAVPGNSNLTLKAN